MPLSLKLLQRANTALLSERAARHRGNRAGWMARGASIPRSCVRGGILSIAHHKRTPTQSTAASDSWLVHRKNGTTDDSRARSLVSEISRFGWVGQLPCASSLRVSFCLKGLRCSASAAVLARHIAPAKLHSCVEEPEGRTNGTEAVCAFRFLVDNYAAKDWSGVYFAHDDVALNRGAQYAIQGSNPNRSAPHTRKPRPAQHGELPAYAEIL